MNSTPSQTATDDHDSSITVGLVVALCGLIGAWTAAGAAGLLAHPLRHALVWLALGCALVALLGKRRPIKCLLILGTGLATALVMTVSSTLTINICAIAVFLAAAAAIEEGTRRIAIQLAAEAVVMLAIYHFLKSSLPVVWQAADAIGTVEGKWTAAFTRHPLWVGATFGGLDYLVVMPYLAVMAPLRFQGALDGRKMLRHPIALGLGAVVVGHATYLACLSFIAPASASLPVIVQQVVPDNMLAFAMVIHVAIAGLLLYFASRSGCEQLIAGRQSSTVPEQATINRDRPADHRARSFPQLTVVVVAGVVLAVLMCILVSPSTNVASLRGKKIVLYEKGFLNWLKPEHGQYGRMSIGMYGMLPIYLKSLGAQPRFSSELSESDLRGADALILLFPDQPWHDGQLERIWKFVRGGGALLVMGEHTVRTGTSGNRFNDVLKPTAMHVRFDSAMFRVGGWLQSYEALWHPTTAGIKDTENDFGVVIGASVQTRPPARPLLVGRWGWADPGDETSSAAMMGNGRYDAGEKLGDLILAAEQPFGKGKIIVFGDTSSLSNAVNITCHDYTARLLAYLADTESRPIEPWRQGLALIAAGAIVILLTVRAEPPVLAGVALALSATLAVATARSHFASTQWPGPTIRPTRGLAYVDASHLGVYSGESWRQDGVMGLCLTLMRNDYLTLLLPSISEQRLRHVHILISIAPAREYNKHERKCIARFVRDGGTFIITVGKDRVGPSRSLLSDFGFKVGAASWQKDKPIGEFEPLGHFKSPYFNDGDRVAYVRFHAAWPIHCDDPNATVVARHPPNKSVIVVRSLGQGQIIVVGDTCFAMNKNLEHENGAPFEGLRENAVFWQWFLAFLEERAARNRDDR